MLDIDFLIESGSLYKTHFGDGLTFGWRLLTIKEYRIFRGLRELQVFSEFDLYYKVFKRVYVGDPNLLNRGTPLGIYISIGQLAMYLSGDIAETTIREDIESARVIAGPNTLDAHMQTVIFTAFPSFTPDDLEQWDRKKFLRIFAMAEQILVQRIGHEPIDLEKSLVSDEQRPAPRREMEYVDFDKEAEQITNSLGWEVYEQQKEELEREKQNQRPVPKGLTRKQLAHLDKLKASKRGQ